MVLSLALGWAVIFANRTCLYPLLPVIATTLGITSAQVGLLSSVYYTLYVILQIPGGVVMSKLGTKKCLVAGSLVSGVALLCIGFFGDSYSALLFFFGMQGVGDSFYYAAAQTSIVAHAAPEKKSFYSALLGVGMSSGVLVGLGLSQPLYMFFQGYRMPFFLLAFPTLAVAVALWRFVPDVRTSGRIDLKGYIALFRDAEIWRISLSMFCLMYGFWVVLNWGPAFLELERGFVAERAGFYSALVALAAVPGGLLWSRVSDRIGRKAVIMMVLPLSAFFLFAIATVGSFSLMVLSLLAFGFCTNAAIVPVSVVWVSHIAGKRYPGSISVAIAFFNCVIIASAIIAPVLSGFIRDVSGSLSGAIFLGAGIILLGPLLVLGVSEKRERFSSHFSS